MTRKWGIESLAKHHDRGVFDCGNSSLNKYIRKFASQNDRRALSKTYVAVKPGTKTVLGFHTLASSKVEFASLPPALREKLPRYPIPVILLARLAVDLRHQGNGLGRFLMMHAFSRVLEVSRAVGVRGLVVKPVNHSSSGFYGRFGFISLHDDTHLFLPLETIVQAAGADL